MLLLAQVLLAHTPIASGRVVGLKDHPLEATVSLLHSLIGAYSSLPLVGVRLRVMIRHERSIGWHRADL